ncbi:NUDIX hydrolase [Halobacillus litoralis]|uniref:NUDIX hydrolase n=1 Tax=Halobacillus litoralis TaxID=45668 RepID=UPI0024905758|nr:NUDIX hydrolase [Halobacillus litoralis]
MNRWCGASGVCFNDRNELLMVLQGKPKEEKKWTIPSGGMEGFESFEECCKREVSEETGYIVEVIEKIKVKEGTYVEAGIEYEVHYFSVRAIGGEMRIQDPDELIHEIKWVSKDELEELNLSFPEDLDFLALLMRDRLSGSKVLQKE